MLTLQYYHPFCKPTIHTHLYDKSSIYHVGRSYVSVPIAGPMLRKMEPWAHRAFVLSFSSETSQATLTFILFGLY